MQLHFPDSLVAAARLVTRLSILILRSTQFHRTLDVVPPETCTQIKSIVFPDPLSHHHHPLHSIDNFPMRILNSAFFQVSAHDLPAQKSVRSYLEGVLWGSLLPFLWLCAVRSDTTSLFFFVKEKAQSCEFKGGRRYWGMVYVSKVTEIIAFYRRKFQYINEGIVFIKILILFLFLRWSIIILWFY